MLKKWTGQIDRPLRVWRYPRISDDIYLHFSEILKSISYYAPRIGGVVLDVGAGKTPYKHLFNYEKYVTLDNHDYPNIDIVADATKRIPLKNNSFDSVLCIQMLEHITKPQKVIDEIHRVLKKDGRCLLTTHMAAPLHGVPYDYYRFTPFILKELFKKFKHIEVQPHGGAALSIVQLIVWGISEKLPRFAALPLIIFLNIFGKALDKAFYSDVFTLNYAVYAVK